MSKILADGTPHEVGDKPLTLMCHRGDTVITVPDAATITPTDTMKLVADLTQAEWTVISRQARFVGSFNHVFSGTPHVKVPGTLQELHAASEAVKHLSGLIILLLLAIARGQRVFLKFPETYLHPAQQSNLASMIVLLSGINKTDGESGPTGQSIED